MKDYIDGQFADYRRRLRIKAFFANQPPTPLPKYQIAHRRSTWDPKADQEIERYLKNVQTRLHASIDEHFFRVKMPKYNPPWLRNTLQELRNNQDIIVTNADKNMGTAVVKTEDYISEALRQLSDESTYMLVDNFCLSSHWDRLRDILIAHGFLRFDTKKREHVSFPKGNLHRDVEDYLMQLRGHPALRPFGLFYLLMKVHKKIPPGRRIPPGRPIVSSINTFSYFASKFVDRVLQPLYKLINSYVASSDHLICLLEQCNRFPEDCVLLCADIESLYPNIPIDEGLVMFRESICFYDNKYKELHGTNALDFQIDFIVDVTRFVLTNNYFSFGEVVYQQVQGTAMGTPLAVVFACFVVDYIEREVLSNTGVEPLFFRRYIDDFFIVTKSANDAMKFIEVFNRHTPSIRCPEPVISAVEGIMLDLKIFKGPDFSRSGRFSTSIYQKPQNKYLYLPPSSFHSHHMYPAMVQAEIHRYRTHCSRDEDFATVCKSFYTRLLERGYSAVKLDVWFQDAYKQSREELLLKIRQRYEQGHGSAKHEKQVPFLFKCYFMPQTQAVKISKCLKPIDEELAIGSSVRRLFNNGETRPIPCYMNTPCLHSFFRQSRKHLHGKFSNDHVCVVDLDDP